MKWRGKMANDIDVVITWVDDNDVKWRNERAKYLIGDNSVKEVTKEDMRFRNWDNLQYVFRGIEKYMPWVRKIHFVTYGHLPKWLNTDNPKLNIVRHEDFMPKEYLPSFNGCAIALNMHRIPGLSEQFIYFNDDMFVIKPTKPEDFFKNGIPCDMACLSPQPVFRNMVVNIETNNLEIINDHFTINDVKYNKRKWINFRKYGMHATNPHLRRCGKKNTRLWMQPREINSELLLTIVNGSCESGRLCLEGLNQGKRILDC